ncbi:MAG: S8 family serine peptidase, partial [Patescibacteria group bacterium]
METKNGESVESAVARLESDPIVEYAEPNYIRKPATISSNDTYASELWGLDNTGQTVNGTVGTNDADIDAPEAWGITEGNSSLVVAVIDWGVAYNHPDLAGNMWDGMNCKDENGNALGGCNHGYDFEYNDKTPLPTLSNHGTHVAGTIAAVKDNSSGIIGVAPDVKIMALKFSGDVGDEIQAIDFAIQNGVKIINASFGIEGAEYFSQLEYDAINRFKNAGGLFIAAAGNGGPDDIGDNNESTAFYPCNYDLDNIICVAATDQNDSLTSFSNYGTTSVDVAAPGKNIYSTIVEILNSEILNETFDTVTPPNIPTGWSASTGFNWGTYDFNDGLFETVLYGDLTLPYTASSNSTLTSAAYNLSGATKAQIEFFTQCDTEYTTSSWDDYMALEVSGNGVDFTEILRWDEAGLDNDTTEGNHGSSAFGYAVEQISSDLFTSNFQFRL